jgi:hypothetical protein
MIGVIDATDLGAALGKLLEKMSPGWGGTAEATQRGIKLAQDAMRKLITPLPGARGALYLAARARSIVDAYRIARDALVELQSEAQKDAEIEVERADRKLLETKNSDEQRKHIAGLAQRMLDEPAADSVAHWLHALSRLQQQIDAYLDTRELSEGQRSAIRDVRRMAETLHVAQAKPLNVFFPEHCGVCCAYSGLLTGANSGFCQAHLHHHETVANCEPPSWCPGRHGIYVHVRSQLPEQYEQETYAQRWVPVSYQEVMAALHMLADCAENGIDFYPGAPKFSISEATQAIETFTRSSRIDGRLYGVIKSWYRQAGIPTGERVSPRCSVPVVLEPYRELRAGTREAIVETIRIVDARIVDVRVHEMPGRLLLEIEHASTMSSSTINSLIERITAIVADVVAAGVNVESVFVPEGTRLRSGADLGLSRTDVARGIRVIQRRRMSVFNEDIDLHDRWGLAREDFYRAIGRAIEA